VKHHLIELSENQRRQYVDGEALLRAVMEAQQDAAEVRGSMLWREMRGVRYLIRTSARGAQRSLGLDSPETRGVHERFLERKHAAQLRLKSLNERLVEQQKLNRVYRVGRAPNVVVRILNELNKAGIADQFLAVGTHALYAYESACGVQIGTEALATRDIDLLFDTRKNMAFLSTMKRLDTSLISVLRKADSSFKVLRSQLQTAVNDTGFEVDIIRRMAKDADPHPLRMTDDENALWAVQVPSGETMLSSQTFEQMVVSVSGEMAMMRTLDPMAFMRVKKKLAQSPGRDPVKRPKDKLQADIVKHLWDEYLRHRPAA